MKNNLKEVMKEKNLSIDDFARKANVTVGTVQNWRKAEKMKTKTQEKIAKLLGVKVFEVFD